jgi:hypothetical protein
VSNLKERTGALVAPRPGRLYAEAGTRAAALFAALHFTVTFPETLTAPDIFADTEAPVPEMVSW